MALPKRKPVVKKEIKKKEKEYLDHFCDECRYSTIYNDGNFENLDYKGEPIFLQCPNQEWRIVRNSQQACHKFVNKI